MPSKPVKPASPRPPKIPTAFGQSPLRQVLAAARRPASSHPQASKTQYAVHFADEFASCLAVDLQPDMKGIVATTKRQAVSVTGRKQLDVNFSTLDFGLALGISLKSVHIRERDGRYTHNMKRNEEELRIEALGYHKRQPFAVMIGVLCLPFDSCDDGKRASSSFGSWVRHLRPYGGRVRSTDDTDHLERIYVALYDPKGGALGFFDIRSAPPENDYPAMDGEMFEAETFAPRRLLTYAEFRSEILLVYKGRNVVEFKWADGTPAPLSASEIK